VRNPLRSLIVVVAGCIAAAGLVAGESSHRLLGQGAPDFALKATSGTNFRLSEHRGDVVLLAFWGSRCGQCGAQLSALSRLVDTYRSAGLAALAVNVDDNQVAAAEFAIAHPVLLDPDKAVARAYRVDNLPLLLLIDRSGTIRHVHRDHRSGDEGRLLERIRPLLDE
jgi:peroxiredoxin